MPHMRVAFERKSGANPICVCLQARASAGVAPAPHPGAAIGLSAAAQFSQANSSTVMDALLTDGNERAALAAARSLVCAGYEVGVAASRRFSLAGVSRGVCRLHLATDPLSDPAGYAAEVGGLASRLGARVLLPVTDASVEAILDGRRYIPSSVALPFPELKTFRMAADKAAMLQAAHAVGLGVPETIPLEDAEAPLPGAGFFPAVLKPHRSVVRGRRFGVQFVNSRDQCRAALRTLPAAAFPGRARGSCNRGRRRCRRSSQDP